MNFREVLDYYGFKYEVVKEDYYFSDNEGPFIIVKFKGKSEKSPNFFATIRKINEINGTRILGR